jgi:8-oxo-dGTP pyrophosphatase MutT (NUDIX family)
MAIEAVTPALLARLDREAADDRKEGTHRPTVALVIRHMKSGRFLIVMGKKDRARSPKNPGILKGGIDEGEHIIDAAYREAREEIRALRSDIDIIAYCDSYSVNSVKKKENFGRKRYFVFYAKYDGPRTLTIDGDEIVDYAWVKSGDIGRVLRPLRKKRASKYKTLLKIFSNIRKLKQKRLHDVEQETKA